MHITLPVASLLPALRRALDVADPKSTLPILGHVCLRAASGTLTVTATDLNLAITAPLAATVKTPGALTLPARALHDIVANLAGPDVTLKATATRWCELKSARAAYRLVGLNARDFPAVEPTPADFADFADLDVGVFARLLAQASPAMCGDETRAHLNGIMLQATVEQVTAVATDGHRLVVARGLALPGVPGALAPAGVIVPRRGVVAITKLLATAGKARLAIAPRYLHVAAGDAVLAVKLVDMGYPPWQQVIPRTHPGRCVLASDDLRSAAKRAALMANDTRGLKLAFAAAALTITADGDHGASSEDVECTYAGEPVVIGVNPEYLRDALAGCDAEQIAIALGGALDPLLITPADGGAYEAVIMPMRV